MEVLCEEKDCKEEATTRYQWPWGDEGIVCDGHRGHMVQLAQQLGRDVAFTPLHTTTPAAAPTESPELRLAKAKLLEQEQLLHEQAQTIADLRAEFARSVRAGRFAAQVDSDVEAPTASTDPAESHHATPSPPTKPQRSR